MGIKKWIALILLLIANLSVVAHNILPHHHHEGVVCLSSMNGDDCCHENECSDEHQKTHHHCDGNVGECELQKTIVRHDNVEETNLDAPLLLLIIHHCCGLSSCHMEESDITTSFRQKPYLDSYFTTYVSPTLGLRAPPHVSFLG